MHLSFIQYSLTRLYQHLELESNLYLKMEVPQLLFMVLAKKWEFNYRIANLTPHGIRM